ncbi:MAG TPA: HDOD domain-containing protein [Planctomycetaceae bacterium]|jgi:serine/threonine-protein kinase|nr:HDOD domain-containing protein [Planctomycetaceae bacterium]
MDWVAIRDEALGDLTTSLLPPDVKFPALPQAVTLFVQRSRDESVPLQDLAKILEADSGLTIQLLKYVNSSFLAVKKKVVSVVQALSLLGSQQSLRFVIATGMEAAIRAHASKLINQNALWSTNLQKAIFSREVALLLKTDPEVAFVGSLLQDYVLPVLTNDLSEDYRDFVPSEDTTARSLSEFEQARFGWDHGWVGACLAFGWNLPDELVCCICYHHSGLQILTDHRLGRSPVAATALSALLPDQFCPNNHGLELLKKLESKWPAFNLQRLAESVDRQYVQMGLGIHNSSPLLPRCKSLGQEASAGSVATMEAAAER